MDSSIDKSLYDFNRISDLNNQLNSEKPHEEKRKSVFDAKHLQMLKQMSDKFYKS